MSIVLCTFVPSVAGEAAFLMPASLHFCPAGAYFMEFKLEKVPG